MKIDTFHSMAIHQSGDNEIKWIYLDYSNKDEYGTLTSSITWNIKIYGQTRG